MKKYQVRFDQLKAGVEFFYNGNTYLKVSTRTAHLLEYNRRLYFGMADKCIITDLNKLNHKV